MKPVSTPEPSRRIALLGGSGLLVVIMLASAWMARSRPASKETVLASAAVLALGTLIMALFLARWSRYPRWAWYGTALVMAGFMILSATLAQDPERWIEQSRSVSWMYPWLLLVMTVVMPASRGRCAPTARWGGWLLMGTGVTSASRW